MARGQSQTWLPRAVTGLGEHAERSPDARAIVAPDGRPWSRKEVDGLANRLARAFVAAGIEVGSVVAIVAPNCGEYLAAYFACIRAGLRVVPINWHLASRELKFILRDCEPRAAIVHERLAGSVCASVAASLPRDALRISIGGMQGFRDLHAVAARFPPDGLAGRAQGRLMPYTSATTGRPKGVLLPLQNASHAAACMVAWHRSLGIEPEAGNVHLCTSMLYHSAPLKWAITALRMGHCVVLADRPNAQRLLSLVERFRVTTTFMVPTSFVRLLKLDPDRRARYSTRSLRFVFHGGAPCPIWVKRRMLDWWGPILWESYGASEAQGTIVGAEEWLARPGTVGRAIPGSAVRVRDARGRDCAPMVVGRVYLRPYTGELFAYKGDPGKTRACIDGDLVTVGDLGYLDEAGYLYLCDRECELILCSGMNVYPAEIESVLVQHEAVADCAVVGADDALFGQVPVAYVETVPGRVGDAALTLELLEHLRGRLAPMKWPRRIRYVDAMPRDPSGKLHRQRLRA